MNRVSSGGSGRKHYDNEPKLNLKKVAATLVAIIAIILVIISIKNAFTKKVTTKNMSVPTTYFTVYTNDKYGVIDNEGKTIIEPNYDEMIVIPNKNKDLFICTYNVNYSDSTYNTKVLNANGEELFKNFNNVEAIQNYSDKDVWYEDGVLKYEANGKYGLIDGDGKVILQPEYDKINALQGINKSIVVEKESNKGLVNNLGEIIIEPKYSEITALTDSYENGYIVKNSEGKYGVIAPDKTICLETRYDSVDHVYGSNMYVVTENGSKKIVKSTGEVILESGFEKVVAINGQYIIVENSGKQGVINLQGQSVIPSEYESLSFCFESSYIACKDGKYGVISTDGTTKVEFKYSSMSYVKKANFIQADNDQSKTEVIDKEFKPVLSNVIISEINTDKGYLRVRTGDEYKYYNFNFEEKKAQEVLTTNTLFLVKENGKYGYENSKGQKIVDCKYDDAKEQNEYGYCAVKKDGRWGVLKSNGSVLLEPSVNLDSSLYINFVGEWYLHKELNLNIYTK